MKFTVYGNPKALKRHRTFRRGKCIGSYDPSEGDKSDFLALAHKHRPNKPIDYAIKLTVTFIMQRPKAHYGTGKNKSKLKDSAPSYHISRPDLDNLLKFICDALNGVFWKDDTVISEIKAVKMYGECPRTVIEILCLKPEFNCKITFA